MIAFTVTGIGTIQAEPIPAFPAYAVSSDGRCWSCWARIGSKSVVSEDWKQIKPIKMKTGYLKISVSSEVGEKKRQMAVHRLVLELFVGKPPVGFDSCHNNGDRTDNRLENLRWANRADNLADRLFHGTLNNGTRNGQAKLKESEVVEIRKLASGGARTSDLAKQFGVKAPTISAIKSGKNWRFLNDQLCSARTTDSAAQAAS